MPEYTVVDIAEDGLESAYFIVRATAPQIAIDKWLESGRGFARTGVILGLRGPGDMLFGILAARLTQKEPNRSILSIHLLTVLELARAGAGRRRLLDAALDLARNFGCEAIEYPMRNQMVVESTVAHVTGDHRAAGQ